MKNQLLAFAVLCLLSIQLHAQSTQSPITVKKSFLSTTYRQHGKNLTLRQLIEVTANNADAQAEMKLAKKNADVATVLGAIGGFMVGWPLGTAIGGGEPNWALAGVGAGFIGVGIPFSIKYAKHAKNAVALHNESIGQVGKSMDFSIGINNNGLALKFTY